MQKLISIELQANFGFFRKPDANAGINLSYNMLHKPAFLGILGAIIGLEGYKELGKLPEYYEKLSSLKIGIEPLEHEKGNFAKTVIKYSNTVGYANKGATYLTEEATLIAPSYRCYLLLDMDNAHHQKLYEYLKTGQAEYLPYFGKNEFYAWWESSSFNESYNIQLLDYNNNFKVNSLICLNDNEEQSIEIAIAKGMTSSRSSAKKSVPFVYLERLPFAISASDATLETDKKEKYAYQASKKFVFSNVVFDKENKMNLESLYQISANEAIHLF